MALAHESVVFDIHDVKLYPLILDSAGASPTYGSGIDVPGIAELSLDMDLSSQQLKGDAQVIATKSRFNNFTGSITWGKIDLDVLAAILGGTVADTGSTPNQQSSWSVSASDLASMPYFKLMALMDDTDESMDGIVVVLYKAQITGGAFLSASSDNFGQPTIDFNAVQPIFADTPMIEVTAYETSPSLSGS